MQSWCPWQRFLGHNADIFGKTHQSTPLTGLLSRHFSSCYKWDTILEGFYTMKPGTHRHQRRKIKKALPPGQQTLLSHLHAPTTKTSNLVSPQLIQASNRIDTSNPSSNPNKTCLQTSITSYLTSIELPSVAPRYLSTPGKHQIAKTDQGPPTPDTFISSPSFFPIIFLTWLSYHQMYISNPHHINSPR
jgi:hypothetical protein